ncbi:hypothetical protein KFE98_12375 [bacterium SCSIO 12741]|nr:hypothetical protein KFE98_12375 [bacterium SCSIO 12741]
MKHLILTISVLLFSGLAYGQEYEIDQAKIKEDLDEILTDLSHDYIYLSDKKVDLNCIRDYYEQQIPSLKTEEQVVLFFEYLLDEFYDSHLILSTNRSSSYRLYSPVYASLQQGSPVITQVWQTQLKSLQIDLIGAEVVKMNGVDMDQVIEKFPTHCNNKNDEQVREWIVNKILAGRYNQPRVLTLKLANGESTEMDLDQLEYRSNSALLTSSIENGVGVIRLNNSLGNGRLIDEFDQALNGLMNTEGLIIDLRNTVDGGDSYIARAIMGHFIQELKPYQKHWSLEQYEEAPAVERSWTEFVSPRKDYYSKPVVILVGRWTGSMGEGLAIGFEGMGRAIIVGSEMERLAGEMNGYSFVHQNFGYRISTAKLFHIDGTPREEYVPENYVTQTTYQKDEVLEKGIELIKAR